jgi:hypothetical protein
MSSKPVTVNYPNSFMAAGLNRRVIDAKQLTINDPLTQIPESYNERLLF